jgi:hypothetical protein
VVYTLDDGFTQTIPDKLISLTKYSSTAVAILAVTLFSAQNIHLGGNGFNPGTGSDHSGVQQSVRVIDPASQKAASASQPDTTDSVVTDTTASAPVTGTWNSATNRAVQQSSANAAASNATTTTPADGSFAPPATVITLPDLPIVVPPVTIPVVDPPVTTDPTDPTNPTDPTDPIITTPSLDVVSGTSTLLSIPPVSLGIRRLSSKYRLAKR